MRFDVRRSVAHAFVQNLKAPVDALDLLKKGAAFQSIAGCIQKFVPALLQPDDLLLRDGGIFV